jgi:hypothetical protein
MLADPHHGAFPTGSRLRQRGVCILISAVLLMVLASAALVQLSVLASLPSDVASVFLKALMLSSLLGVVPFAVLWFLDRRERESPWLFAAAFLWGGCITSDPNACSKCGRRTRSSAGREPEEAWPDRAASVTLWSTKK